MYVFEVNNSSLGGFMFLVKGWNMWLGLLPGQDLVALNKGHRS